MSGLEQRPAQCALDLVQVGSDSKAWAVLFTEPTGLALSAPYLDSAEPEAETWLQINTTGPKALDRGHSSCQGSLALGAPGFDGKLKNRSR